jgi:DNA (cytosine-5)-methyltransferase 1
MEKITFIDFFAGVGGFRRGMELAGHKCVGFCEYDKYATASYTAMHLCTEEQLRHLLTLPMKERQKEILKEEYRNGEWYADDIRTVDARDLPRADCWCFGFPCQDISIAGKQLGFTGNRSSLFFRVMYLVGQLEEEKKPTWLFIENVKNLLSVNGGWDFARLLTELDENGYDAEWEVLNSKDYGVPQNRERCFIIGCLRGRGGRDVFPLGSYDTETPELQGHKDRNRVITNTLDTRIDADTRGTYPIIEGGGTAVKMSGYHKLPQGGGGTTRAECRKV